MKVDAISRDAVLEKIGKLPLDWEYGTAVSDCYKIVENVPALDVAPVVHARWIPSWEPLDLSDVYFRCSACHTNFNVGTEIDMEMAKYCPKCGARMDGETDV